MTGDARGRSPPALPGRDCGKDGNLCRCDGDGDRDVLRFRIAVIANDGVEGLATPLRNAWPFGRLRDCVAESPTADLTCPYRDGNVGRVVPLTNSLVPESEPMLVLFPFNCADAFPDDEGLALLALLCP